VPAAAFVDFAVRRPGDSPRPESRFGTEPGSDQAEKNLSRELNMLTRKKWRKSATLQKISKKNKYLCSLPSRNVVRIAGNAEDFPPAPSGHEKTRRKPPAGCFFDAAKALSRAS
jgi:hypothetical protein